MAKTLLPIGVSSALITVLCTGTAPSGPRRAGHIADAIISFVVAPLYFFVAVVILSAVGLLLLQPIVWLIRKWRVSFGLAFATMTITGAALGWLLLSWMPKDALLGAAAGTATAAIWFAFNRDLLRSRPET